MEVLLTFKSQKTKRTILSSTVEELYFHGMFWFMPVPPWIVDGHIW